MIEDQQTYRRATHAAVAGLVVQVVMTIVVALVGLWAGAAALGTASWYFLGGVPIWFVLVLVFYQHRLERAESLEAERLGSSDQQTAALFEQRGDELHLARRRLDNLHKWGLGLASLVVGLYLVIVGLVVLVTSVRLLALSDFKADAAFYSGALNPQINTLVLTALLVAVGMAAFLMGRYIAGMTKVASWQLLRGGAGYLMGNALVAAAAAIGAVLAHLEVPLNLLAYLRPVMPALMVLIGVEILLTFLLSAYRPRKAGEVARPAFDSRVLGLLTTPASIARAVSDAINYQFGFEVSRSWFFRLLGKALTPLVVFALVTLLAATSVLIVAEDEQAVVTRFGRIVTDPPLGPGLYLKMPWPISSAQHQRVRRVHQMMVGSISGNRHLAHNTPILWTNPHADAEEYLITASQTSAAARPAAGPDQARSVSKAPSMSLVAAEVAVHYQIEDMIGFVQSAQRPGELLEAICQRVVIGYFATRDIDSLLSRSPAGRSDRADGQPGSIGRDLRDLMRAALKTIGQPRGMGVRILMVHVAGIHPPQESEVAVSFYQRIGAELGKQSAIEEARRKSIEQLGTAAGSEEEARRIYAAILAYNQAKTLAGESSDQARKQESRMNRLLAEAQGQIAEMIYGARAYRWRRALGARNRAQRFQTELVAYRAAPHYYRVKRYLEVIGEGMKDARKVIVPTTEAHSPMFRIDMKEQLSDLSAILPPQ